MPSFGGYTFRISSNGNDLEEYEVEEKGNGCSCWIASDAGQNFSIKWTGVGNGVGLKCYILLDGSHVKSAIHLGGPVINSDTKGCSIDNLTTKLFAFSQVSLTDDEALASFHQDLADLGTIELLVYRASFAKSTTPSFNQAPHLDDSAIHERSKKMSMHRVAFQGTVKTKTPSTFYNSKVLEKEPHARFIFKYRPKDFLRAQGMIPDENNDSQAPNDETPSKSNTPPPPENKKRKRNHSNTENEEQEELKAREILKTRQQMEELQAKLNLLEKTGPNGAVKREVKSEPFTFLPVDENGVIDLTDD